MSASSDVNDPMGRPLRGLEVVTLLALLVPALLRTVVSIDPFPYWSANPLESWVGLTGLSPAAILLCDCLTILAAGAFMWLLTHRGIVMQVWQVVLTVPAMLMAAWWGVRGGGSVDHLASGMPWAAGLASAMAASSALRVRQARRVMTGVVIGISAMLALKAGMQVLVEHPALIREFNANRESIFAANGWTADSPMARAYERRVMQSEGTGWFGLANPFATIGAAVCVFGLALVMPLKGDAARKGLGVVIAGVGAVIMILAGAKGGYAAALVGVVVLGVAWVLSGPRFSTRKKLVNVAMVAGGIGAVVVPLLLVGARGLAGERLGELSIWFRAMYVQAATRIFLDHPWLGVGPAGFKDAYLLAKNPLNPEEVASPHSVIADFASGLGVAGLLVGVFVIFAALVTMCRVCAEGSGSGDQLEEVLADEEQEGMDRRLIAATLVTPVLIAAYLERDIATIENLIVRVVGLALAVMVAVQVTTLSGRRMAMGLGAAALAAIAHAQVEMTPVLNGSSGWFWLIVGMGASATLASGGVCKLGKTWSVVAALACVIVGGGIAVTALPGVFRWNAALKDAALEVKPLAEVKALLQQGGRDPVAMKEALAILSEATGKPVSGEGKAIQQAVEVMLESGTDRASRALMRARNEGSGHYGTSRAYSQLLMFRAELALNRGDRESAKVLATQAIEAVSSVTTTGNAARFGWIGTLWVERAKRGLDGKEALVEADRAFEESGKLDPWSLNPLLRQIEVVKNMGDDARAATLAKSALWLHGWTRLDPLKGLTDRQKAELERLAGVKSGLSGGAGEAK